MILSVWVVSVLVTGQLVVDIVEGHNVAFELQIAIWLWLTVLFANFAEALAEGRGKAQAESLRKTRTTTIARLLGPNDVEEPRPAPDLRAGDRVVCEAGDVIPADGEIIEGIASVDESAVTGESAPVIRESGGDRSGVTGGTRVLSDRIVIRVTANPGETFLDRMIALVEGAERQRTPNEIALSILLAGMSLIFLVVCAALVPMAHLAGAGITLAVLAALFVSLIPTTIGALLSAIGIAGMNRLVRRNVLATSGRAVEAAGDVSVLLLDKTGTITLGNRQAARFLPVPGVSDRELAEAAQLSSLPDETPEGRSIVVLAKELFDLRGRDLSASSARFIAFSAETRMSGVDLDGRELRKGAGDAVRAFVEERGGTIPGELAEIVDGVARSGSTPLVVSEGARVLGVVELKDVVKDGIRARFEQMRAGRHPHRHDHGRQPPDRGCDRGRGRRRRLPRRGDSRGQARADPQGAGGRPPGRDDGRRHQRRPRAGPGRRRRGHECGNLRGQGGRQHGRPRLEPDEAPRRRPDRQAAPDHARGADDVLDRERPRQVLRDHPGDLRHGVSAARLAQHPRSALAPNRRSCPRSSSTR